MSFECLGVLSIASGAWTPANLTGLAAWYKADVGVYTDLGSTAATNNSLVEQWNDQSGNGYHLTQTTSGNRPTFLSAGYNSKPTVKFTFAGNTILTVASVASLNGATNFSCFTVCQMNSGTAGYGRAVAYMGSGHTQDYDNTASACIILRDSSNAGFAAYCNGQFTATAISYATNYRLGMICDHVNWTPYVNNVSQTPVSVGAGPPALGTSGTLGVGAGFGAGSTAFWDGPISEIVLTNTALTSTDRNNLDTYFTNKW